MSIKRLAGNAEFLAKGGNYGAFFAHRRHGRPQLTIERHAEDEKIMAKRVAGEPELSRRASVQSIRSSATPAQSPFMQFSQGSMQRPMHLLSLLHRLWQARIALFCLEQS